MTVNHLALGCDLGSFSVKLAIVDEKNNRLASRYRLHGGDVMAVFVEMIAEVDTEFGDRIKYAMVCGLGRDRSTFSIRYWRWIWGRRNLPGR